MISETLITFNVQCKAASSPSDQPTNEPYRLRIGGHDKRRVAFKGWVTVEKFIYRDRGVEGSYVVMKRDEVSEGHVSFIVLEAYFFPLFRGVLYRGGSCGRH